MQSIYTKIKLFAVFLLSVHTSFAQDRKLTLWDDRPAQTWMTEAYPLGNGRMGGMVFGGVSQEHIQFNEISLWTGDEQETGAYQAFGDLYLNFQMPENAPKDYRRQLDISKAVQEITYTSNRTVYKRQYFCSFPDQVMVLHFTADKKAAYSALVQLSDAHQPSTTAEGTRIKIAGKLPNGLKYQAVALIKNDGGTCVAEPDGKGGYQLNLKQADGLTIILSAATDYSNQRKNLWRGEDPELKVNRAIAGASAKTFQQLLDNHLKDYQSLFGRVSINLGRTFSEIANLSTHERLINYKKKQDPELEALLFQYGRYLLISSSRKGGLPANLQGLWNESNNPPWRSDYHSNINIQMNYWLAEPTNLSECHFPYLDYINSMREVKKEHTQKEYPGVRGWTVRTENNIFGGESFTWNTPGSAWYVQDLWEHYAFTKDKTFLKNFAYPILKEVTMFWDDHLKRRPDGTLVSPMGWSPEHGPTEDGVSYDQQIVYDLFTNYIAAADILGLDKTYKDRIINLRANLLKPKIGKWGQLQEWETDRDDPKDTHRHASHLFGLHPGKQFSVSKTPEIAEAARVSLQARGDESTGWSKAWKMNFWARLHDGDHAYTILKNFITLAGGSGVDYNNGGGVYANLLCAHPPFQIDGNLGYTAGIAEMLVQSQTDEIELLPALPKTWAEGYVDGLKARGNFELSHMEWKAGKLVKLRLKSLSGGFCKVRSSNGLKGNFQALKTEKVGQDYVYSFNTSIGKTYEFAAAL